MQNSLKIIKNQSGGELKLLGVLISNSSEYDVPYNKWFELANDEEIITLIGDEDVVINNGIEDLPIEVAKIHVKFGVKKVFKDMDIITGAGENAPGLEEIDSAVLALSVDIGDKFYSSKRMNNLVGDDVKFRFYMCVDNSESNKWGQATIYYKTTDGDMDTTMNIVDGNVVIGPVEIPTTPYLVFAVDIAIPTTNFNDGEILLFVGVERETPTGKDSPTNPFLILKYEVEYWEGIL